MEGQELLDKFEEWAEGTDDEELNLIFEDSVFRLCLRRHAILEIAKNHPDVFKAFVEKDFVLEMTDWKFWKTTLDEVEGMREGCEILYDKKYPTVFIVASMKDHPILFFFSTDKDEKEAERKLDFVRSFSNQF